MGSWAPCEVLAASGFQQHPEAAGRVTAQPPCLHRAAPSISAAPRKRHLGDTGSQPAAEDPPGKDLLGLDLLLGSVQCRGVPWAWRSAGEGDTQWKGDASPLWSLEVWGSADPKHFVLPEPVSPSLAPCPRTLQGGRCPGTSRDTTTNLAPLLAAVLPLCEQLCPATGSNERSEPAPALPWPCSTAQPRATRRRAEPSPFSPGCLSHA